MIIPNANSIIPSFNTPDVQNNTEGVRKMIQKNSTKCRLVIKRIAFKSATPPIKDTKHITTVWI